MLTLTETFEDFNGDTVTETHYFNLTIPELQELQVSVGEGMSTMLQRIVQSGDAQGLLREFKKIVLASYGEKSEDGRLFTKDPERTNLFVHSAAYAHIMTRLSTSSQYAADFVTGMMPKEFAKHMKDAEANKQLPTPSGDPQSSPTTQGE